MLKYDSANRRNYFAIYDLKQYIYTDHYHGPDMYLPIPTMDGACVATDNEYIYVLGGRDPSKGMIS